MPKIKLIVLTTIERMTGRCKLLKEYNTIPIPTEAIPIVISRIAIKIKVFYKDIRPQHIPLANGKHLQNLGSFNLEKF